MIRFWTHEEPEQDFDFFLRQVSCAAWIENKIFQMFAQIMGAEIK
ncbi:hypothetical protein GMMP15_840012 [Candidatus Magnetomoraceae bacterium gMMP-15]